MADDFGAVLSRLLLQQPAYTTALRGPNYSAFVLDVPGVSYESLRKAVTNERPPGDALMMAVAEALDQDPSIFAEWRRRRLLEQVEALSDDDMEKLEAWLTRNQRAAT